MGDAKAAVITGELMRYFDYGHLTKELQDISKPFYDLAEQIYKVIPDNQERGVAFRKLLEAKDCAVRAYIFKG